MAQYCLKYVKYVIKLKNIVCFSLNFVCNCNFFLKFQKIQSINKYCLRRLRANEMLTVFFFIILLHYSINPLSPKMTFFHHGFQRLYFLIKKAVKNLKHSVLDVELTDLSEYEIHFSEKCTCDDLFRFFAKITRIFELLSFYRTFSN